jgi:hypothetical protein
MKIDENKIMNNRNIANFAERKATTKKCVLSLNKRKRKAAKSRINLIK